MQIWDYGPDPVPEMPSLNQNREQHLDRGAAIPCADFPWKKHNIKMTFLQCKVISPYSCSHRMGKYLVPVGLTERLLFMKSPYTSAAKTGSRQRSLAAVQASGTAPPYVG